MIPASAQLSNFMWNYDGKASAGGVVRGKASYSLLCGGTSTYSMYFEVERATAAMTGVKR